MELTALQRGQGVSTCVYVCRSTHAPCALVWVAPSKDDVGMLESKLPGRFETNARVGTGHQAVQLREVGENCWCPLFKHVAGGEANHACGECSSAAHHGCVYAARPVPARQVFDVGEMSFSNPLRNCDASNMATVTETAASARCIDTTANAAASTWQSSIRSTPGSKKPIMQLFQEQQACVATSSKCDHPTIMSTQHHRLFFQQPGRTAGDRCVRGTLQTTPFTLALHCEFYHNRRALRAPAHCAPLAWASAALSPRNWQQHSSHLACMHHTSTPVRRCMATWAPAKLATSCSSFQKAVRQMKSSSSFHTCRCVETLGGTQ